MAGPDGVSSNQSVTLEGRTLSGPATGPAIDTFRTAGGVYTGIYNDVGRRLGTTNEATILREIHRQFDAQTVNQRSPQDTANGIVNSSRNSPRHVDPYNTQGMAAQILQIRRDNPAQAAEIERLVFVQLTDAGDQSRLAQDLTTATGYLAGADARLGSLGPAGVPAQTGTVISRAALTERANALIEGAIEQGVVSRGNPSGTDRLNVHELAYQVEQIAAENPRLAQVLRADLTIRLGAVAAADFNRVLAGDTSFGEGIGRAFGHPGDGLIGAGKGIANGFIAIGDLFARGSAMQAAGEQQQAAGFASLFGNEEQAAAHLELAEGMRIVAGSEMIQQIPYSNIAQSGGGDVGTVVDVALAGKGIVTGGARLLARNADEVAEVVGGQADEVGGAAIRATDKFDEIAANVGIDMRHILDGHMNAKGKAVGFHARPEGIDPPGSRMTEQVGLTNPDGVYQGRVEILNPATGNWVPKSGNNGLSSFFPDRMNANEVEASVRHAYAEALRQNPAMPDGQWRGDSGFGFQIVGVIRNGEIRTAYPVF